MYISKCLYQNSTDDPGFYSCKLAGTCKPTSLLRLHQILSQNRHDEVAQQFGRQEINHWRRMIYRQLHSQLAPAEKRIPHLRAKSISFIILVRGRVIIVHLCWHGFYLITNVQRQSHQHTCLHLTSTYTDHFLPGGAEKDRPVLGSSTYPITNKSKKNQLMSEESCS